MIKQRVISALVLLPLIFLVVWFGGPAFSTVVALIATLAALELYRMAGLPLRHPLTIIGVAGVLGFILVVHFERSYASPILTAAVTLPLIWLLLRPPTKGWAWNWMWVLGGMIYIGWLLSHLISLRGLEGGRDWVLLVLFSTFAADTLAFFVGRAWGRRPLAPRISPGKTWEGTLGGVAAAIAASLLFATVLPTLHIPLWQAAIIGVLVGIFAPIGDLAESTLKRSIGIKDSGALIPGHGGMLDRLDSVLVTSVVVYYYVTWLIT